MAQFICKRCRHSTGCVDHKGHTVNVEQCGDFERRIRHLVTVEVEIDRSRKEPDQSDEDYIEQEIAWSGESFHYQKIKEIVEV